MLDKYMYFLGELKKSEVTEVSELSSLLFKNLTYYKTGDVSLDQCFSESKKLEFIDNDDTNQDLRSYNYIRDRLYDLLTNPQEE